MKIKDFGFNNAFYNFMASFSEKVQPQSYLEIGVNRGGSLKAVIAGYNPPRLVLSDTWGDTYGGTGKQTYHHIFDLLVEIKYLGSVTVVNGHSKIAIPKINEKFDMILVDGDHSYEGALQDLKDVWPLLNDGGHLLFDDIIHPNHKFLLKCWEEFIEIVHANEVLRITDPTILGNGIGVIQK